MSSWREDFIPINRYTRPGTLLNGVNKLVLHWTSNPGATAAGHKLYFGEILPEQNELAISEGRKPTFASAHIFVDPKEAVCIIPLNELAFHANENYTIVDGKPFRGVEALKPNANLLSIAVEMCVESNWWISQKTITRSLFVMADLCRMFNLTEKDIVRHFDVTRKPCPYPFVKDRKIFDEFKMNVGKLLRVKYPGYVIKKGSKGLDVSMVQHYLGVNMDGSFGSATEIAVRQFQKENRLLADGKVGEKTWNKLFTTNG